MRTPHIYIYIYVCTEGFYGKSSEQTRAWAPLRKRIVLKCLLWCHGRTAPQVVLSSKWYYRWSNNGSIGPSLMWLSSFPFLEIYIYIYTRAIDDWDAQLMRPWCMVALKEKSLAIDWQMFVYPLRRYTKKKEKKKRRKKKGIRLKHVRKHMYVWVYTCLYVYIVRIKAF